MKSFASIPVPQSMRAAADVAAVNAPSNEAATDDTPEARMSRRYPQKVKAGELIGREVVVPGYEVMGIVDQVVRSPAGKIKLIVSYSRWFGWFSRPVAMPIEVMGALGKQIGSVDVNKDDYAAAPTWVAGQDSPIPKDEIILIAIAKR